MTMQKDHADHASVKIHPPILLLLHLLSAYLLNRFFPLSIEFPNVLSWAGYVLVLIGLALPFSAVIQFMQAKTTVDPHGSVTKIVTNGAYRFTRNPIYLGFVCMLIGFLFIFKSYWGLILSPLFIVLMNVLVINYEEAYLEKKFGEQFTSYTSRVRRWL